MKNFLENKPKIYQMDVWYHSSVDSFRMPEGSQHEKTRGIGHTKKQEAWRTKNAFGGRAP
jgi:hypothetical protein